MSTGVTAISQKRCLKCGEFIVDSLMPLCDDCFARKPKESKRAHKEATWHWEEGFEPKPAA